MSRHVHCTVYNTAIYCTVNNTAIYCTVCNTSIYCTVQCTIMPSIVQYRHLPYSVFNISCGLYSTVIHSTVYSTAICCMYSVQYCHQLHVQCTVLPSATCKLLQSASFNADLKGVPRNITVGE